MNRSAIVSYVVPAIIGAALLFGLPHFLDLFGLLQVTLYVVMAILALSLGFIWGYGGILCLGQSAFFGLGAYAYSIAAFDLGESTVPVVLSIALPALFAAALGYLMFYGRISEIYVGVITLTVTLILFNAINSTAGPEYHIWKSAIGGYNGLPNVPGLNYPFDPDATLQPDDIYMVTVATLIVVYFGIRWILNTRFGRVLVAIRENEKRVEFIGFDARLHKLLAFAIGAGIAGAAGCLFVNWGSYVSPTIFSMVQSAQIIIWVMVGGVGTLIGPILGAVALSWLAAKVGTQHVINSDMLFGGILIVFVLLVPRGLVPMLTDKVWSRIIQPNRRIATACKLASPESHA
jgi:urea ABC transporter permease protein UrtC